MAAVYATVTEVRAELGSRLPDAPTVSDTAVQEWITRATRACEAVFLYWPPLGDDERPSNADQKQWLIVAVAETVHGRYLAEKAVTLSPELQDIVARGGRVKAGKLEVQGAPSGKSAGGQRRTILTSEAMAALWRSGVRGGGVRSW